MESPCSFWFSSPESDVLNSTDIKSKKDEMISVAEKILENVNLMSFANMDFQQVRSMMRIEEIARGIVESKVKKVTEIDVDSAMLCASEKMAKFCRHADGIPQMLEYEGMGNGLSHSELRMEEFVSTIITKRTKLTVSRNNNPIELVDGVDAMTVESKINLDIDTRDNSRNVGKIHKRLLHEEANMNAKTGNREDTLCLGLGDAHVQFTLVQGREGDRVGRSSYLGARNVQVKEELHELVGNKEAESCNGVQFTEVEGNQSDTIDGSLYFGVVNAHIKEEDEGDAEAKACNGSQSTEAEENLWYTIDRSLRSGVGHVHVEEENVLIMNAEAESYNVLQFTQEEGSQGNTIDGSFCLGFGNFQLQEEQQLSAVGGEAEASNDTQAEGMLIENVEVAMREALSANQDENSLQEETFNLRSEPGVIVSIPLSIITWPGDGKVTFDWLKNVMSTLDQASKTLPLSEFQSVMPITVVDELMNVASNIFSKEPNCVEVDCHKEDSRVVVVGDIHGQYHDLLNLFELAGLPSEKQFYVFNGDYVDRGAWGLEVLMVLSAWKVLMPDRVYLLRGNHETKYCTSAYGFEDEVKTKFGDQSDLVYKKCLECFKNLPLASVISNCVYTAHGGLFRSMNMGPLRRSKRKGVDKLKLGSLEDLSKVNRYIIDVADEYPSVLTDVLWSDPSNTNGLIENGVRGLGLSWGPDCTETFLRQSKLKLIIRSHQGPDARVDQDDFGDMLCGYSMDHVGKSGKLYTLFSAPSYPQFGETKFDNDGAYAVLTPPNFENPSFHSFKGVERPKPIITGSSSASRDDSPAWMSSVVDSEALGISNLPLWSVSLADNAGGTQVVQVPRAPSAEGLPLHMPSNLQETQRAAFEYLLELVAGLKLMLSSQPRA